MAGPGPAMTGGPHPCGRDRAFIPARHPYPSSLPVIPARHPCPLIPTRHPCPSSLPVIPTRHPCPPSLPVIPGARPGDPRLSRSRAKRWMAGPSPAMTGVPHPCGRDRAFIRTLLECSRFVPDERPAVKHDFPNLGASTIGKCCVMLFQCGSVPAPKMGRAAWMSKVLSPAGAPAEAGRSAPIMVFSS